jgi:hypothetical protein
MELNYLYKSKLPDWAWNVLSNMLYYNQFEPARSAPSRNGLLFLAILPSIVYEIDICMGFLTRRATARNMRSLSEI